LVSLAEDFTRYGAGSGEALEQMLRNYMGSVWFERAYMDITDKPSPRDELLSVLGWYQLRAYSAAQEYSPGVTQFVWQDSLAIDAEHLRKSLFLASRSAFIFPEEVYVGTNNHITENADEYEGWRVRLSADFIRNLFAYRQLIDAGAVDLLGSSLTSYSWMGGTSTENAEDAVPDVRALTLTHQSAAGEVVSALRSNRQVLDLSRVHVPWIAEASLDDIVNLRTDNGDLLSDFQRAYHCALIEQLTHAPAIDFDRVSRQIEGDIVGPSLRAIERRYNREIASHRRLRRLGATVAFLPLTGTVIAAAVFQKSIPESLVTSAAPAVGALASTLMVNRFQRRLTTDTLEDQPFFLIWKITKGSGKQAASPRSLRARKGEGQRRAISVD
jgi:hypothetical protein